MAETVINAGAGGTWDIVAPEGVTVATSQDPQTGVTTGLRIFVDFTYDQWINASKGAATIHFIGPATNPTGTPQPLQFFQGLVAQTTFAIRNDLGVPMQGLNLTLVNDDAATIPGRDVKDAHPDDYAHFHQVLPTSFSDKLTGAVDTTLKGFDPTLQPAFLGAPTANENSPSIIDTFGVIQPDAIWQLGGGNPNNTFTLHSEDTPGPTGGSFTLSWFTLDTPNGDPQAPDPNTVQVFPTQTIPAQIGDHQDDGKTYVFAGISSSKDDLPAIEFVSKSSNALTAINVISSSAVEPAVFGDLKLDTNSTVSVKDGLHVGRGTFTIEEDPTANLVLGGKSTLVDQSQVAITSADDRGHVALSGDLTLGADNNNFLNIGAHLGGTGMMFIQAANDTMTVNAVDSGVSFNITAGTLNVEHPTDFHGTIGTAADQPFLGPSAVVQLLEAADVSNATFDTATGMLHLLTDQGADRGDIHIVGNLTNMTLNRTLPDDSFVSLQDGGGTGNIAIKFT